MINEIKSECIYVGILWIIITWGVMLVDIHHRWRTQEQKNWEYVITVEDPWVIGATTGK